MLLAAALPDRMKGKGADLGAGWGFLSRAVLARDGVTHLDLVEADHAALDCARANIADPRAAFHWADATVWRAPRLLDFVVMNPPFHRGRAADPALGEAFLAAAARSLAPDGTLWLVANRGLPYDRALNALFREVQDIGADPSFRLIRAARPLSRR
jgi:16S rRNA (guanine1207-N2)-methyltransferase